MSEIDKSKFDERQLIELIYAKVEDIDDDVSSIKKEIREGYVTQNQMKNFEEKVDTKFNHFESRVQWFKWIEKIFVTTVFLAILSQVLTTIP